MIPWRNKGKELYFHWPFNLGFHFWKEESDYVNIFTKSFAHILNYEFYRLYSILEIVLISYSINAWLHFTNNNLHIEEFFDRPIFLNPHTKLDFCSNNPLCVPPKSIQDKFTLIRELCRFLQPGLISYDFWSFMTFPMTGSI